MSEGSFVQGGWQADASFRILHVKFQARMLGGFGGRGLRWFLNVRLSGFVAIAAAGCCKVCISGS
jgi:hypothetical protein